MKWVFKSLQAIDQNDIQEKTSKDDRPEMVANSGIMKTVKKENRSRTSCR